MEEYERALCRVCGAAFATGENLRRHRSISHLPGMLEWLGGSDRLAVSGGFRTDLEPPTPAPTDDELWPRGRFDRRGSMVRDGLD
jgi:hypothetical protein